MTISQCRVLIVMLNDFKIMAIFSEFMQALTFNDFPSQQIFIDIGIFSNSKLLGIS